MHFSHRNKLITEEVFKQDRHSSWREGRDESHLSARDCRFGQGPSGGVPLLREASPLSRRRKAVS